MTATTVTANVTSISGGIAGPPGASSTWGCSVRHHWTLKCTIGTSTKPMTPTTAASLMAGWPGGANRRTSRDPAYTTPRTAVDVILAAHVWLGSQVHIRPA